MFNAKDEEIRELLSENSELWLENFNIKMKIFNAIEYIKNNIDKQLEEDYLLNRNNLAIYNKELLEILGDNINES